MSKIWYGLEDRVVAVTGGTRGIGLEIAKNLLDQRAKVIICARKQEGLDAVVESLGGGGENLLAVRAHIAREGDVDNLFEAVKRRYGKLDVLINNVGMNLLTESLVDTEPAVWQKIMDTNLNGTFLCSKAAGAIMREQKRGKIVNISSIAGRKVSAGMGIYGIAKAGVEMLTKVLAVELAPYNVQVNAVVPSMVKTDFSKPFWSKPDVYDKIVEGIPLGRIAHPSDVMHVVLFLSSEAADFITGETILVDGGSGVL